MPPQQNQAELSDVQDLEELEDLLADPSSSANQHPSRRPLWLLVALALSLTVALLLLPYAVRSLVFPATEKGECLALYPQNCISLSTAEITETFSVMLPASAEIVDSGSNGFLLMKTRYAVVALDADQASLALERYEPHDDGAPTPNLKHFGLESVSQELVQKDGSATAFVGTNSQGETLVCLLWTLNR